MYVIIIMGVDIGQSSPEHYPGFSPKAQTTEVSGGGLRLQFCELMPSIFLEDKLIHSLPWRERHVF